jgi:hypothetical protein
MPFSYTSVRNWLVAEFSSKQATITAILVESKSLIHILFNLWTSPHKNIAVLGIVTYFIKPDYTNEAVLLALRQLEGSHSGENIAIAVVKTL